MKNACCVVQYLYQSKSVCKADWYLESLLADKVPIRPDRERMLSYQAFYIWWFFTEMQPQKITACPEGNGKIHLVDVFAFLLFKCNPPSYIRTEIEKYKPGPDLVFYHLSAF